MRDRERRRGREGGRKQEKESIISYSCVMLVMLVIIGCSVMMMIEDSLKQSIFMEMANGI